MLSATQRIVLATLAVLLCSSQFSHSAPIDSSSDLLLNHSLDELNYHLANLDQEEIESLKSTCLDFIKEDLWGLLKEADQKMCTGVMLYQYSAPASQQQHSSRMSAMNRARRFFAIQVGKNQKPADAKEVGKGFKYGRK